MMFSQVDRQPEITLQAQKARLNSEYINFQYLYCYRSHNVSKIVFISEGRKEKENDHRD